MGDGFSAVRRGSAHGRLLSEVLQDAAVHEAHSQDPLYPRQALEVVSLAAGMPAPGMIPNLEATADASILVMRLRKSAHDRVSAAALDRLL